RELAVRAVEARFEALYLRAQLSALLVQSADLLVLVGELPLVLAWAGAARGSSAEEDQRGQERPAASERLHRCEALLRAVRRPARSRARCFARDPRRERSTRGSTQRHGIQRIT